MKCNNCNKEITDNKNYCYYCGECLVDESTIAIDIERDSLEEINSNEVNEAKEKVKKNKFIFIMLAAVVIVVICAVFIWKNISSRPLDVDEIKESIVGQTIYVEGERIKLTNKILSEVKIKDRDTKDKSIDEAMLKLKLNYKDIDLYLDCEVVYLYDSDKHEWNLSGDILTFLNKIDSKDDIDKIIKNETKKAEEICNACDDYAEVYGYQVSEVSNIKYEDKNGSKYFTADIELSNGIYTTTGEISGYLCFNFFDMEWEITYIEITDIKDVEKNKEIDEELLLKVAKEYLSEGYAQYEYEVDGEKHDYNLYITNDMISEFKINNYKEKESSNNIRLEVEGKANNGVVKDIEFKGVMMIPLKVGKDFDKNQELKITKIEIEAPDLQLIKDRILYEEVGDEKIDLVAADTFEETSRYDKYIDEIYVNGTITLEGESKVVQVKFYLEKSDYEELFWKMQSVVDEKSDAFIEYE